MAEPSETWSERFEREFEAVVRLLRRRPVLAIVFALAMAFYAWFQFFKSKDDAKTTTASVMTPASAATTATAATPASAVPKVPKMNRYRFTAKGGGIDDELVLINVTQDNKVIFRHKFGIIPDTDFFAYRGDILQIIAIDYDKLRCYGFAKPLLLLNVDSGEVQKLSDPILNCDRTPQKAPYQYLNTIGPIVV